MASLNWQRIREIFEKCVELEPDEQHAFLERECGDEAELRREIQKLLDGHNQANSKEFLEWPDNADETSGRDPSEKQDGADLLRTETVGPPDQQTHRRIGPYKLLQEIGHGGMGTVWLAQQTEPVNRRVAIKLIKSRLSGKTEIARFDAERQALALMNHPNIAKVFDAGTTEDGAPYYVMEFINGLPVTEYCDKHKLSIRDRLQVFIPICRAIQHAHQKGIIHRDLKPSNILVAESEGFPVPIVIDFGLAKAVDHQRLLTDKTLFTEIGKVVGTLQYMSPEQAALNSNDIDSRTDIYSLGIILYELLTGMTPLDRQTIKDKAILKVLEIICQSDTPRPSYRLSSSGETITTVSEQRQIEPRKLQSILRGELDWVVMKALEKDRNRRYDSASSFADDIHRFLIDEPVVARPASNTYRIGKFVARNRMMVTSASIIGVLAMIGVGLLIYGYYQSQEKLDYANRLAEAETASMESLKELTDSVTAELTGSNTVDIGAGDLIQDPVVKSQHDSATLLTRIGLYLRQTGANRNERKKWFYKGVQKFQKLDSEGELANGALISYATALNNASLEALHEKNSIKGALEQYDEAILILDKLAIRNDAIKSSLVYFQTYWNRGEAYIELGRKTDAKSDYEEAIVSAELSGNKGFLDYLPYLEAQVLRCKAESEPVAAASSLEYVTRDIANKGETLIILASVYSLAADAEEDKTKQQRWVDKAIEAIEEIKTSGKLAPIFKKELITNEDFEFLRQTSEFKTLIGE